MPRFEDRNGWPMPTRHVKRGIWSEPQRAMQRASSGWTGSISFRGAAIGRLQKNDHGRPCIRFSASSKGELWQLHFGIEFSSRLPDHVFGQEFERRSLKRVGGQVLQNKLCHHDGLIMIALFLDGLPI